MQSKIYIAVNGCKRGFSMLYTSPGFDPSYPGIAQSLCDMRKFLRVAKPGIDYFGLDFIQGFRICSIYRSTIDSAGSSGGFISVALIIPDNVISDSVRQVLVQLLETYYAAHYNRQFATPVAGTSEDGTPLETLLASHASEFKVMPLHFKPGISDFNALPLYVSGCNETVVDTVFGSPYHQAYLKASKLIMLPASVMSAPQAYSVVFNTDVRTISAIPGVSDRLSGRMSALVQQGCALTSFILNGVDFTSLYHTICLIPIDSLSFSVLLPNGRPFSFSGTLRQAINSSLILSSSEVYGFNFFSYDVAVSVKGYIGGIPRDNILMPYVVTQKETSPIQINANGEGFFRVTAPFNMGALALVSKNGKRIILNPSFITSNSDMRAVYPIELRVLTIRYPRIVKGQGVLNIGNASFPVDVTPNPLTLLLPVGLTSPMSLAIGHSLWSVDPITGAVQTQKAKKKGLPIWAWCVGVAVLLAIIGGVCIYLFRDDDTSGKELLIIKHSDASAKTDSVDGDNTEFTQGVNADGSLSNDTVQKKPDPVLNAIQGNDKKQDKKGDKKSGEDKNSKNGKKKKGK